MVKKTGVKIPKTNKIIPKTSLKITKAPKITKIPKKKKMTKVELEQVLIDNFVNLQKVLTNLTVKFEDLSSNISKLLQLFEISAKSFTEKYGGDKDIEKDIEKQAKVDKEFLKKLDSLMDQNKTIAKGIMMMEEKIRHRSIPSHEIKEKPEPKIGSLFKPKPKPLPRY